MRALARGFAVVGRLLRGLLAAAVLLAVLAGLPVGLVVFIGWPLPDHIPGLDELRDALTSPLNDQTILDILAVLAWILWAHFLRDVAVEAILATADISAARHGRTPPARRRVGPVRFVAAILVGAIAGAILLDLLRGAARPASTSATAAHAAARTPAVAATAPALTPATAAEQVTGTGPRPAIATPAQPAITSTTAAGRGGSDAPARAREAPGGAHHVVKGDNLWDIAETRLGDPFRWREIYVLNRDKPQANGYALRDPDEIHIGWWLAMPARDHATTPPPPPADSTAPGGGSQQTDEPGPADPATPTPAPSTAVPSTPAPQSPAPGAGAVTPAPALSPTEAAPAADGQASERDGGEGVVLPSQAWVSLGLATMIAAVAGLLRLQRRRRARLAVPIEIRTGATPSPVPQTLRTVDAAGSRVLDPDVEGSALPGVLPAPPAVPAPIGVSAAGEQVSLFALPGTGVALTGDGAVPAARAVLAAVLSTGVTEHMSDRPLVVTTIQTLTRLLPPDVLPVGLDPGNETFDEERLVVAGSLARAVTALEEEMVHRRRLLDNMDEPTMAALNARHDHAEHQPPFVLLAEADHRYAARVAAVAQHRTALHVHAVLLGECDGIPGYRVALDGSLAASAAADTEAAALAGGRLATLAAQDLADVLELVRQAAPRAEAGVDIDDPFVHDDAAVPPPAARADLLNLAQIPTPTGQGPAPVRLSVLGPLTLATEAGPIRSGVRSGSLAVLAMLAAHPAGRTLEQLADDLHPNAEPEAGTNLVHTDIVAARTVLRGTTGITGRGRFIVHDGARGGRYRIDPDLIEVDLWRMLAAIDRANKADDDETAMGALQEAAQLYGGDFAAGQDRAWALDYATTYRHQILGVYARIAELLETDHPEQAVAALEEAIALDPVNEELYQRLMRIHGRQNRPDAVRRTLRLLEDRLAEIGEAEPSEATRRVATRQLTASASRR